MSQSTPRKFSEKIAIMQRKQNEDMEQYNKVMSEVKSITSTNNPNSPSTGSQEMMQQNMNMMQNSLSPGGLVAGPAHPLLMGWNRPGGSLPNVHQMVQQPPVDPYANWNYWQAPTPAHGQHARNRSPGHYHPYMQRPTKPNERIPPLENHVMPANIHLQPPDPSWSKARSDPAIHMNAMNPNFPYNGCQQWMPEFLSNGAYQQIPGFPQQHNHLPNTFSPHHANVPQQPQSTSYPQPIMNTNQQQQQQQELPVGSLPNMHSPFSPHSPASPYAGHSSTGSFSGTLPGTHFMSPQSVGAYPTQQQLTTPSYLNSESQSAPTSPAGQKVETNMQPQWPQTSRHFSASPDTNDIHIPDIHITGADGSLDCFQDLEGLHLDNDIQELLSNNSAEQVDPACETQLLN